MCRRRTETRLEVADVIRRFGSDFRRSGQVSSHHLRTLSALERCRTAALGGHLRVCTACGVAKPAYNSCRNRHCPKCGGLARELWIDARQRELLPVRYQHIVFTIPAELNDFCRFDPNFCYDMLFKAAWATLDTFGRDPKWLGARLGATMILHTWGQNLSLHPHLHCIVPAGGLDRKDRWTTARKTAKAGFLFPVKAMSKVFRGIFMHRLMEAWADGRLKTPPDAPRRKKDIASWRRKRYRQDWVVYAKAPFAGPKSVVEYLGRYSHKVAISNHRLIKMDERNVHFSYKDYRQNGTKKVMSLSGPEFLRRFCQHILPPGFRRIRHYGILSNFHKQKALAAARASLGQPAEKTPPETKAERKLRILTDWIGRSPNDCPDCGAKDSLINILLPPNGRAPPNTACNTAIF